MGREELEILLQGDNKVKVAGIDADGVLRGKVMSKDKFLSAVKAGFGFCRGFGFSSEMLTVQCYFRMGHPRQGSTNRYELNFLDVHP
jgi:hypothetical protein